MPVHKRTYRSRKVVWFYEFNLPGATRQDRIRVSGSGFATKKEAADAEVARQIEEQQKRDLAKAGASIVAAPPKTLSMLLAEFISQHAEEKLAPKTIERYREQVTYLHPELVQMPLAEITPLHLSREWNRMLKSGGHTRRDKMPRPMSAKTVRNIAGVVSSAFGRAIKWGLITRNPVSDSEPPVPKKHYGIALTPAQQDLLIKSATSPWCLPTFLEMSAATGARRGEVLALRWSDIQDGRAIIARSLTQTKHVLEFKGTKTERPRAVSIPPGTLVALEAHRKRQDGFRQQFGPDYRTDLDLIFANPNGSPLKPDSVSAAVSLLSRRLKLPKGASLHTLRHSHSSHLLADGVDLATVSERLGHSSVRVTAEIYSHALRGRDDDAARRWERFQSRNSQEKRPGVQ
jgi:integrase